MFSAFSGKCKVKPKAHSLSTHHSFLSVRTRLHYVIFVVGGAIPPVEKSCIYLPKMFTCQYFFFHLGEEEQVVSSNRVILLELCKLLLCNCSMFHDFALQRRDKKVSNGPEVISHISADFPPVQHRLSSLVSMP